VTIATDGSGYQRTPTDGLPQARHAAALFVRAPGRRSAGRREDRVERFVTWHSEPAECACPLADVGFAAGGVVRLLFGHGGTGPFSCSPHFSQGIRIRSSAVLGRYWSRAVACHPGRAGSSRRLLGLATVVRCVHLPSQWWLSGSAVIPRMVALRTGEGRICGSPASW
jgi:hypothetical protein